MEFTCLEPVAPSELRRREGGDVEGGDLRVHAQRLGGKEEPKLLGLVGHSAV